MSAPPAPRHRTPGCRSRARLGAVLLLLLLAARAGAGLPRVRVERVVRRELGGDFSRASIGIIEGRPWFLKSRQGSPLGTRYANLEADLLAGELFARVGVRAPRSSLVRLVPGSPLRDRLGEVVLKMELVDAAFAGAAPGPGRWPGRAAADLPAFLRMLAVDLLIANSDRRDENFFTAAAAGRVFPIPIDANAGFSTMVGWFDAAGPLHFLPTYRGLEAGEAFGELGTIRALLFLAEPYRRMLADPGVAARVRPEARAVVEALDDAFLAGLVGALPPEILPPDLCVDPGRSGLEAAGLLGTDAVALLFEGLRPGSGPACGSALLARHRDWLLATLRWRRDHLLAAWDEYLAWRAGDPGRTR